MFSQPVVAPIGTQWVCLAEGVDVHVAVPEGSHALGGVIVAGEIFGITAHVHDICERLARAGYLVAAPDFYWRQQRGTCLSYDAKGRKAGVRMLRLLRRKEVVADVAVVRAYLTTRLGAFQAMAIVGVSAGGHIALLAATRLRFALAVSIYGGWMVDGGIPLAEPTPPVADCAALAANGCFFLGIAAGGRDRLITTEQWLRLDALLGVAGVEHELIRYAGARHGFLCAERSATFDAEASADMWRRLLGALAARVAHEDPPADGGV